MKKALLILTSFFAAPAFAGFDVNDARILGQYEMVQTSSDAEIDSVKIIYNHDGKLVLVRDEDFEWPLSSADKNGVVYQGEDEPNPGSGDEPNCYYDASIVVKLTEGQKCPRSKGSSSDY